MKFKFKKVLSNLIACIMSILIFAAFLYLLFQILLVVAPIIALVLLIGCIIFIAGMIHGKKH